VEGWGIACNGRLKVDYALGLVHIGSVKDSRSSEWITRLEKQGSQVMVLNL
jgi:hypothetical protein